MRNRRTLLVGGLCLILGLSLANWWMNRPRLTILFNGQPDVSIIVEAMLPAEPVGLDQNGTLVISKGHPGTGWFWVKVAENRNLILEIPTSDQVTYDFYPNGLEKTETSYFLGVFPLVSRTEQVDLTNEQLDAYKNGREKRFELDRSGMKATK